MALIIESTQIFFEKSDTHDLKNSLSKTMKENAFNQIAEVKDENGVVIGRTYQSQPKLLKSKIENQKDQKEVENVFKFKASED